MSIEYDGYGPYNGSYRSGEPCRFQAIFSDKARMDEPALWAAIEADGLESQLLNMRLRAVRDLQVQEGVFAKAEGRIPVFAGPDIRGLSREEVIDMLAEVQVLDTASAVAFNHEPA